MMDRPLTLRDHLEELRRRVFISALAVVIGSAVAFAFVPDIIELLKRPVQGLNSGQGIELHFFAVTEGFASIVKVSFFAGFILAFPIILYQTIRFVAPGLSHKEKRYLFAFLPGALVAFMAGVAFGYFVLVPPALRFLVSYGSEIATPIIGVKSFVDIIVRLLFWMGIAFETPLVMYLLAQLGIVSPRALSRFRRFWLVIAFVLAAIITPTFDPLNQALVAIPLLVLYEVGILLARLAWRGRQPAADAAVPAPRPD